VVEERVLVDAAAALSADDAMSAVMALGDRESPLFVPLLRAAVMGELGDGAARSALKRIGRYADWHEMQAAVLVARDGPNAAALEPYLSARLSMLPAACAEVLRVGLRAAPRDARAWVQFAPCVVQKGAVSSDAIRLQKGLEPLGAKLVLRGPDAPPPAAPQRPWWKLW
jgi:hypothetical protein